MAMKVKVEKRKPEVSVSDFQWPAQANALLMAWCLPLVVVMVVGLVAFIFKPIITVGLVVWYLISLILLFKGVTAGERKTVQAGGLRTKVMANNYSELKQMIIAHARALGIPEPTAYVVKDDLGRIDAINQRTIAISAPLLKQLKQEEISCALLRACVQIRLKQANLRAVARCWKQAGFLWWVFCLPACIFPYLIDLNWVPCAEITADRMTLLYMKQPRTLTATVLKLAIEAGEVPNIEAEDVEEYLSHRQALQVTTEDVHAHFKLGTALHENPTLNERVKEIINFAASPEYKELSAKIDEVLADRQPATS